MRSEPFSQRFDRRDVNTSSPNQPVDSVELQFAESFDFANKNAISQWFEFTLNHSNTAGAART
jgi:hypothetical protein